MDTLLTQTQLETPGCVLNTVATFVLMLDNPAIGIHNSDYIVSAFDPFHHITVIENNIRK